MKKLLIIALASLTLLAAGCNKKKSGGSSGQASSTSSTTETSTSSSSSSKTSSSESIVDRKVTVNFYVDYNQIDANNIYFTCEVENGGLITTIPDNPTESYFPDFPVFKGWSDKEIIDDLKELWDFSKDIVVSNKGTFSLYGIWVAEGE